MSHILLFVHYDQTTLLINNCNQILTHFCFHSRVSLVRLDDWEMNKVGIICWYSLKNKANIIIFVIIICRDISNRLNNYNFIGFDRDSFEILHGH